MNQMPGHARRKVPAGGDVARATAARAATAHAAGSIPFRVTGPRRIRRRRLCIAAQHRASLRPVQGVRHPTGCVHAPSPSAVHLYAERGSPKYEKAALRWLER